VKKKLVVQLSLVIFIFTAFVYTFAMSNITKFIRSNFESLAVSVLDTEDNIINSSHIVLMSVSNNQVLKAQNGLVFIEKGRLSVKEIIIRVPSEINPDNIRINLSFNNKKTSLTRELIKKSYVKNENNYSLFVIHNNIAFSNKSIFPYFNKIINWGGDYNLFFSRSFYIRSSIQIFLLILIILSLYFKSNAKYEEKIKSFISSKPVFYSSYFLIFIIILLLNINTPRILDDYLNRITWEESDYSKLESPYSKYQVIAGHNVFLKTYNIYLQWTGRVFSSLLVFSLSNTNKVIFNVLNTIAYIVFLTLICLISYDKFFKEKQTILLIFVNIVIWFFSPLFGQTFLWLTGSIVYMWSSIPVLYIIYLTKKELVFHSKRNEIFFIVFITFLGIVAGTSFENLSFSAVFVLFSLLVIRLLKKQKLKAYQVFGFLSTIVGLIILYIAPGNTVRASLFGSMKYTGSYFEFLAKNLIRLFTISDYITPFILAFLCLMIITIMKSNSKEFFLKLKVNLSSFIFFIAGLIGFFILIGSPVVNLRALFGPVFFLTISICSLIYSKVDNIFKNRLLMIITFFCILIYIPSLYTSLKEAVVIKNKYDDREKYILNQKEIGNKNIIVKKIESKNRYNILYNFSDIQEDETSWVNRSLSHYYKISSIKTTE